MYEAPSNSSYSSCAIKKPARTKGLHPLLQLFLEKSSIRGASKIKRNSGFLRVLWICYVLVMLFVMVYTITGQVYEYRKKLTYLHTTYSDDHISLFPSITVCNHNPFSPDAEKHWGTDAITSPKQFNQMVRRVTKTFLDKNLLGRAIMMFNYDQIRLYYQNLLPNVSQLLGYTPEQMFVYCIVTNNYDSVREKMGNLKECGLKAKLISIPNFFNCYSIEPIEDSHKITSIMLVVRLNTPDYTNFYRNYAFYQDVFYQSLGARVLLHDKHELPNMNSRKAFNAEPGKLIEVSYDLQRWFGMVAEPGHNCALEMDDILDLNVSYKYTLHACRGYHLNKSVIKKCGCVISYLARPVIPTERIPYCGNFNETNMRIFFRRMNCLKKFYLAFKSSEYHLHCPTRCSQNSYDIRLSSTKWFPRRWQLKWLTDINQKWRILKTHRADSPASIAAKNHIFHLLKDHSDTETNNTHRQRLLFQSEDSTCILVRHSKHSFLQHQEKLSLTWGALICRIGGLCCLTLGLTCAVFVELIEYIFLLIVTRRNSKE